MSQVHVVNGAGPVGRTIAERLAEQGEQVRVLTRSGSGPEHPLVERRQVDVSDPAALRAGLSDAAAVYHCIHASAYTAKAWRAELPAAEQTVLAAAGNVGAVVVFPESLYAYGPVSAPMTEDTAYGATSGKPAIRVELLGVREASDTPTVSVMASDFFGPHALNAHAGERMVPAILAGKTMRVVGGLDIPHSFTYVPDYAAAMIAAAGNPALWDTVLHAPTGPALTQRQLIQTYARAAGVADPKMSVLPSWALRSVGLVHPGTRELTEMLYQFEKPFILDSTRSEQQLGLQPTSMADAAATTVAWWRARLGLV